MTQSTPVQLVFPVEEAPVYTVHCFWSPRCSHVVRESDPQIAHDGMEQHYSEQHRADINRAIGFIR